LKILLFSFVLLFASPLSVTGQGRAPAKISDLTWMAGHWIDDSGGNLSEETWVPPSGDCMVGMWRLVIKGKSTLYELITITAENDGLVMRLRHFDRAGVGWEDKEHPLILNLVRFKDGEVVFQGSGTKGFLRLTYRRVDADGLAGVLEKGASEKEAQREEFRFRRKAL
jgi:uncharacterized protein DUF6265